MLHSLLQIAFLVLAVFAVPVHADGPKGFVCQIRALRTLVESKHEVPFELEMRTTDSVYRLLTTTNGKLGPLFQDGVKPPQWLEHYLKRLKLDDPAEIPWEKLNPEDRRTLVRELAAQRDPKVYLTDRTIPGLVVRRFVRVKFDQPTPVFGVSYPAGFQDVDLYRGFMSKVEYSGLTDVNQIGAVELHVRKQGAAGDLSEEINQLLARLSIEPPGKHGHLLQTLPRIVDDDEIPHEAVKRSSFVMRANLFSEIEAVLQRRLPVKREMDPHGNVYFDSLSPWQIMGLTRRMREGLSLGEVPLGRDLRMAYVGPRGSDTYDVPGLWGLEYRAIPRPRTPEIAERSRQILNGLQATLEDPNFGMDPERLKAWMAALPRDRALERAMAESWYNQDVYDLLKSAPSEVKAMMTPALRAKWIKAAESNKLAKALLHDWSKDPLFFDQPERLARILGAQKKALTRLSWSKDPGEALDELTIFFRGSGIYEEVGRSIGLEILIQR